MMVLLVGLLLVGLMGVSFFWRRSLMASRLEVLSLYKRIDFLELALGASSGGTWSLDIPTSQMKFDTKFKSILGYGDNELEASPEAFLRLCHREDFDKVVQYFQDYSSGSISSFSLKFRMRAKDGTYRWILSEAAAAKDVQGRVCTIVGWHRDVSEDVIQADLIAQHRAQMAQNAKMSALGEMSGGIAHEINNPLTIISGTAQLIDAYLEMENIPAAKIKASSDKIQNTVTRISKIVKSLKSFSRDGTEDPFEEVTVASIIEDTLSFSKERIVKRGVEFRENLWTAEEKVFLRSSEIVQVLVNLLNNALDEVELREERWIEISSRIREGKIELAVTNSGEPIPLEVQQRLFQPFFTTKEVGKGTGLGLSISKGLIERNEGQIYYDAESPNPRFVVLLPIVGALIQSEPIEA